MGSAGSRPFHGDDHDHADCVEAALGDAERLCAHRGARLTMLRRRVLERVWRSHAPVGAYDILDTLRTGSRRAAPPTVYRALAFLIEHGLVHRLESRNAYVGCAMPAVPHSGQFLICHDCGSVGELADPARGGLSLRRLAPLLVLVLGIGLFFAFGLHHHYTFEWLQESHAELVDFVSRSWFLAALFYVLVSTRMPAILFETSFLSNAEDERRLRAPHFQQTNRRRHAAS